MFKVLALFLPIYCLHHVFSHAYLYASDFNRGKVEWDYNNNANGECLAVGQVSTLQNPMRHI